MSDVKSFYSLDMRTLGIEGVRESLRTVSDFQKAIDTLNQKIKETPKGTDGHKLLKTELENVRKAYTEATLSQELYGKTAKEQEKVIRDLTKAQKESEPNTDKWNEYTKAIAGASIKLEALKSKQKAAIDAEKLQLKPLALPNVPFSTTAKAQPRETENTPVLSPNFDSAHIETHRARLKALNEEYKHVDTKPERFKEVGIEIKQTKVEIEKLTKEQKESQAEFKRLTLPVGSYEELSIRLVQLRHQYNQLSEAQRNSPLGKNILSLIQPLDNQIKVIDEQKGLHQRKVGQYENALRGMLGGANNLIGQYGGNFAQNVSDGIMDIVGAANKGKSAMSSFALSAIGGSAALGAAIAAMSVAYTSQLEQAAKPMAKAAGLSKEATQQIISDLALIKTTSDATSLLGQGAALAKSGIAVNNNTIQAADKISIALGDEFDNDAAKVIDEVTKVRNVFADLKTDNPSADLTGIANAVNILSDSTVAKAPAIIEYANRIGAIAGKMGVTGEQAVALGAAFSSLGLEPDKGAGGFNRVAKELLGNIDGFAKAFKVTNKVIDENRASFNEAGKGAKTFRDLVNTDIVGAFSVLTAQMAKGTLTSEQLNNKLKDLKLTGEAEGAIFLALSKNAGIVNESLAKVNGATKEATSLNAEHANQLEGTRAAMSRIVNIFQNSLISNGLNTAIGAMLGSFADLIQQEPRVDAAIEKERTRFNQLIGTLTDTSASTDTLKAAKKELLNSYPSYLKGLDLDKISQSQLNDILMEGNRQFDIRAAKMATQADRERLALEMSASINKEAKATVAKQGAQTDEEFDAATGASFGSQYSRQENIQNAEKAAQARIKEQLKELDARDKAISEAFGISAEKKTAKKATIDLLTETKAEAAADKKAQRETQRREKALTLEQKAEYTYYEAIKKFLDEIDKQKAKSHAAQISDEIERNKALERESTREKILTIEKKYTDIAKTENEARAKLEENIKNGTQNKSDLANFEEAAANNRVTFSAAKATELADIEKALQVELYKIQRDGEAKRDRETKQRQKESFEILTKHLEERNQIIDTESVKKIDDIRTEKTQKLEEFDNTHITDDKKQIGINKVARIELEATYEIKESEEKEKALRAKLDEINATIEAMNIDNDVSFRFDATIAFSPDVISKTKQQAADIQKVISDEQQKGVKIREKADKEEGKAKKDGETNWWDDWAKDKEKAIRKLAAKGVDIAEKFEAIRERNANDSANREKDAKVKALDAETKHRISLVGGNKLEEERITKESNDKKEAIDLEFRRKQHDRDVKSAIISGILAALKIAASTPPPLSYPLIAESIIFSAIQVAAIKSQKFKFGGDLGIDISDAQAYQPSQVLQPLKLGKVIGRVHEEGGVQTKAGEVEGGEWIDHDENGRLVIIKKEAAQKHEKLLSHMVGSRYDGKRDQLSAINIDGGGKAFGNHRSDIKGATAWMSDFTKRQTEMFKPVYPFIPQAAHYVTIINQQQAAPQSKTPQNVTARIHKDDIDLLAKSVARIIMDAQKEERKHQFTRKKV